jgi:hypothetical protein
MGELSESAFSQLLSLESSQFKQHTFSCMKRDEASCRLLSENIQHGQLCTYQ